MKQLNRRKFVGNISISTLSAIIASIIPFNILPNDSRKLKFTIKRNPYSVKRTK